MSAIDRNRCASLQLRALAHQTLHELFSHSLIRLLYFFTAATGHSNQVTSLPLIVADSQTHVAFYLDIWMRCKSARIQSPANQHHKPFGGWWLHANCFRHDARKLSQAAAKQLYILSRLRSPMFCLCTCCPRCAYGSDHAVRAWVSERVQHLFGAESLPPILRLKPMHAILSWCWLCRSCCFLLADLDSQS